MKYEDCANLKITGHSQVSLYFSAHRDHCQTEYRPNLTICPGFLRQGRNVDFYVKSPKALIF